MKQLRFALLALLILPAALSAQNNDPATGVTPRSSSGDFALLFDLGGLAQLALNGFNGTSSDTSDIGAGFGAKYFIADDLALRLGLTLQSSSAMRPIDSVSNDELSVFRFAIAPSVIYNIAKTGPVAGYVGGQVSYAMTKSETITVDEDQPDVEVTTSAFAIAGIIGAEWFPWSSVSLSGEYQLGFGTSTAEEERTRAGQDPQRFELPTETSIGVRSRGVVTAAIYW